MATKNTEPMDSADRLRAAIIADVAEDNQTIGELTDWHSDLVQAWNNFAEVSKREPITDADLEGGQ